MSESGFDLNSLPLLMQIASRFGECVMVLSKRQVQVLELFARGNRQEDISIELNIKPVTVNAHIQAARRKLGAKNTTEAVAIAIRRELI